MGTAVGRGDRSTIDQGMMMRSIGFGFGFEFEFEFGVRFVGVFWY